MKSYVKFEVPKEVSDKAYEAIRLAKQSGSVKKGVNEATKSIERGLASLVVIAEDVEPEEVVMHLPMLCEQRKAPFVYVPTKLDLGKAVGLGVGCAAVAIENPGEASSLVKDIAARITGKSSAAATAPARAAAQAAPAEKHASAGQAKEKKQAKASSEKKEEKQ